MLENKRKAYDIEEVVKDIRKSCVELDIPIYKLLKKAGVSSSTISFWKKRGNATTGTILKIYETLAIIEDEQN